MAKPKGLAYLEPGPGQLWARSYFGGLYDGLKTVLQVRIHFLDVKAAMRRCVREAEGSVRCSARC
jgi:hypothetical protein